MTDISETTKKNCKQTHHTIPKVWVLRHKIGFLPYQETTKSYNKRAGA